MKNQADVVVIGSSNTDLVVRTTELPRPGQTVAGDDFQIHAGGKGANQAVAAARAGARVAFVACIGRDPFGDAAVRRFAAEGIDVRWVARTRNQASGVAVILIDRHGENLISVALGSNEALSRRQVRAAATAIRNARCVVAQLETPLEAVSEVARLASGYGVPMLLNPAPARALPGSLLAQLTFLTPNEGELARLTGRRVRRPQDIPVAARYLLKRGPAHVIVTCGAKGVCWCSGEGARWFKAPAVRPVDTVGAGDCFSGTLAAALARGQSVAEAIRFAVTAAAICVTRPGAQPSMPHRAEILRGMDTGGVR